MDKHLILCIESKNKNVDKVYIDKILKTKYKINENVKLTYYCINGKGNFCESKTQRKILQYKNSLNAKVTEVIYFVDIDNANNFYDAQNLNKKIKEFCSENNYHLVWFCRDIEETFWGQSVSDGEKVKMAKKFNISKVEQINIDKLKSKNVKRYYSNMLIIFDEIFF